MIARYYWDLLRTSYWFVPSLMTVLGIGAALGVVRLDEAADSEQLEQWGWIYTGSAEGARQLLATLAGSMITVAGVVFSIMIVALTQASSQFGPRLLRNFMRDRGNQFVLGTFIATFVYSLTVLRTVRGENGGDFVPHIAVTVGVLLSLASVSVLIFFIHHAAMSMQAPTVIANVSDEIAKMIDDLYPDRLDDEERNERPSEADGPASPEMVDRIRAAQDGYIQVLNVRQLLEIASDNELQLRFVVRPGHFVVAGSVLCLSSAELSPELQERIRDAVVFGGQQTPAQDLEFVINQLVEVAVRALSPGINDPFTAVNCVDHLSRGLSRLAERRICREHRDRRGQVRVITEDISFADVLDTAFRQIRQYGRSSAAVLIRLLEALSAILMHVQQAQDCDAVLIHAERIWQAAACLPQEADRNDAQRRYTKVLKEVEDCRSRLKAKMLRR